jgi:hypothetical protein
LRERISDETSPVEAAEFIVGQMLVRPDGALYARWDAQRNEAVWYYSADCTAIFELPQRKEAILKQTTRGIFRSVIFRVASFAAEEYDYVPLCGFYFLEYRNGDGLLTKKVMVHADFFPEFGVWIKATFITVADDGIQSIFDEPMP